MAEEAKVEIVSKVTIRPSSPTPNHLQHYKISLLDEIAPPPTVYLTVFLFYSATPDHDFPKMSQKLKTSLAEALTLYYPFCGRIHANKSDLLYVDCNDEGALYVEARVPSKLSDFLESNTNQQLKDIKGFLPLDPCRPTPEDEDILVTGIQVTEFACGGIAIGACFSHRICDATTAVAFLKAWSQKAMAEASDEEVEVPPPNMEASLLFPPKGLELPYGNMIGEKNVITKRFRFSESRLRRLKEEISRGGGSGFEPTRVEALTALIWKLAFEALRATDEKASPKTSSLMLHAVNIRGRIQPPLPENSIGNLFVPAISPLHEVEKEAKVELQELAQIVRKTLKMVDAGYVSKLQGEGEELVEALESMLKKLIPVAQKVVPCYIFTSWVRFEFSAINFGWGKPTWACTIGRPVRNMIYFMPASPKDGGGIEAWVNLYDHHMSHFETNPLLLQFASFDS